MKKAFLAGALLVVLAGCATTPVPISTAKQAPPDRILAYQSAGSDKSATLTVIRDEGFIGGGCLYAIYLNRTLAARLEVAEFARFSIEPGEVLIRVARDPYGRGLCGLDLDNWTQRETILKPGEHKTFRLSIDMNGKLDVHRSDM